MTTLLIDWRQIPCPPLPANIGPVIITVRPGETWCRNCGSAGHTDRPEDCCAQPQPVRLTEILYPEEYRICC